MKLTIERPYVSTRGGAPVQPTPSLPLASSSSTVLDRPIKTPPRPAVPEGDQPPVLVPRPPRVRTWFRHHGPDLGLLLPLLALVGVVQRLGSTGFPAPSAAEGSVMARVWALVDLGQWAPTPYSYDQPPLGLIQLAGYTGLTGAFRRDGLAVDAGREAMLFFALVSAALLWLLVRRVGLRRSAAVASILIFGLSPLAVQAHRTVSLDNIAVPWLLLAFFLALGRHRRVPVSVGAALAFGVAVLTAQTSLVLLPFLAWTMFRPEGTPRRRAAPIAAGVTLLVVGGGYALLAAARGELFPRAGGTSLVSGISAGIGSRAADGAAGDPSSPLATLLGGWWQSDPVFLVMALAAAVVGLAQRRLRPFAALLLFAALVVASPNGYVPVLAVSILAPFAALVVAGVAESAVEVARKRRAGAAASRPSRVVGTAWVAVSALAIAAVVPLWSGRLNVLFTREPATPLLSAESWITMNVPRSSRLIADDSVWVDLVRDGFSRSRVQTVSALPGNSTRAWKDSDYVVSTPAADDASPTTPVVKDALANSTVVAHFGSGPQLVQVRRIHVQGAAAYAAEQRTETAARRSAGTEIAKNPNLEAPSEVLTALRGGEVDSRILVVLGQLLATGKVTVGDLNALPGESGETYRQLDIRSSAALPGTKLVTWLKGLGSTYAPASISTGDAGTALVYTPIEKTGLLG